MKLFEASFSLSPLVSVTSHNQSICLNEQIWGVMSVLDTRMQYYRSK